MIYYKFCIPVRGTRRVYLYSHSLKAVDGIIAFEEEPNANVRIALAMRRYKKIDDATAKALNASSSASKASPAPEVREGPKDQGKAPESAPGGEVKGSGLMSEVRNALSGKGQKRSKGG